MVLPEIKISVSWDKKVKKSDLPVMRTSKDVADIFRQVYDAETSDFIESFFILCLNQSNRVVGFYKVSTGGMTGTVADPRVILTAALGCMATSIVLSHNHPSGSLKPSRADEELTRKIKTAASFLDIRLFDHIIMTDESYYSFADEGLI